MQYKQADTVRAIAEYQRLIQRQREMAEDQRWTMGGAIRVAKARAFAEMECEEAGIRRR